MTLKRDFKFICGIADTFFRRAHIKKTLAAIDQSSMTGWEKWLQIELAAFLRTHKDIKAWWRESKYDLDKRVLAPRKTCAVDFLVHEKRKQSHMALELKQRNSSNGCIKGMLRDKMKIQAIKYAKFDIRSVWCLGVHRKDDLSEVRRLVDYHADKMGVNVNPTLLQTKSIGRSGYAYTIF